MHKYPRKIVHTASITCDGLTSYSEWLQEDFHACLQEEKGKLWSPNWRIAFQGVHHWEEKGALSIRPWDLEQSLCHTAILMGWIFTDKPTINSSLEPETERYLLGSRILNTTHVCIFFLVLFFSIFLFLFIWKHALFSSTQKWSNIFSAGCIQGRISLATVPKWPEQKTSS